MSLSEALRQAYARSDSETRHLIAVDLQHSTFTGNGHMRLVNYDTDIKVPAVTGDTYVAHAMQAKEPAVGSEPDEKVKLRVDGTPGTFQFQINRAIQTSTSVYADVRPFAFNMSTETVIDVVGTFSFLVTAAEYDMTTTILTLGHVSPTNIPFPGVRYTSTEYPQLFR